MPSGIDNVVNHAGRSRRNFLRKLIAGAAFALPLLASFSLDGLSVTAANAGLNNNSCLTQGLFSTKFDGNEYQTHFRDIFRDGDIDAGLDVGGTGHTALNFKGGAGAAGSTWGTVLDSTTVGGPTTNTGTIILDADVLIHPFNNSKGVGLLAMAFGLAGDKGLALLVSNAGSSDKLQLVTVDGDGKIVPLAVVSLGAGIKQDVWYHLTMSINPTGPCDSLPLTQCPTRVEGVVRNHLVPSNPDSGLGAEVGRLAFDSSLTFTSCEGEVGIVARAVSAVVDSSVTNFTATWFPPPPPF